MKLKYEFVIKEIAGNKVAVAVGKDHMAFSGMINLNETAAFLFNSLKEEITKEELVLRLINDYDVDAVTAQEAVDSFVAKLCENGLIEE